MKTDRDALAALVRKAQQGNKNAFNELYRQTRERAYFVVFSIAKNEQDALDILQDSYLKAWQNLSALRSPEQFPAWLNQIVGNTAKSFLRQRKPLLFTGGADEDEPDILELQAEKDTQYIPDASMDTEETRRLIMDIVDTLPEDQRLCVLMYYYDELPLEDIAAALDVPKGTVMSRLYHARKKISCGVEDLEKKQGVRLYGAAPVPLVLWALRYAAGQSSTALPYAVLGGSSAAAAGAGIIGAITLPKIAAAVSVVFVLGGAAAGVALKPETPALTTQPALAATALADESAIERTQAANPMLELPTLPSGETVLQSSYVYTGNPAVTSQRQYSAAAERATENAPAAGSKAAAAKTSAAPRTEPATAAKQATSASVPVTYAYTGTSASSLPPRSAARTQRQTTAAAAATANTTESTTQAQTTTYPHTAMDISAVSWKATLQYKILDSQEAVIIAMIQDGDGGTDQQFTIPGTLGGCVVTAIGDGAYAGQSIFSNVEIPEGVVKIGANAFRDNPYLRSAKIPASVSSIGENAFVNCNAAFQIIAPAGSYAESYALANGIPFTAG